MTEPAPSPLGDLREQIDDLSDRVHNNPFSISSVDGWAVFMDALVPLVEAEVRSAAVTDEKFINWVRTSRTFWSLVDSTTNVDGCWLWTGGRRGDKMQYGGHGGTTAHRVAWAFANGRSPACDEIIRHRCDVPLCCNPDHLVVGTQQDNVDDMVERGRAGWQKEVCKNGHVLAEVGLRFKAPGAQECLACWREREDRRRPKHTEPTLCETCGGTYAANNIARHRRSCIVTFPNPYRAGEGIPAGGDG